MYLRTTALWGRVKNTVGANNKLVTGGQMELCDCWGESEPAAGWGVQSFWKLIGRVGSEALLVV